MKILANDSHFGGFPHLHGTMQDAKHADPAQHFWRHMTGATRGCCQRVSSETLIGDAFLSWSLWPKDQTSGTWGTCHHPEPCLYPSTICQFCHALSHSKSNLDQKKAEASGKLIGHVEANRMIWFHVGGRRLNTCQEVHWKPKQYHPRNIGCVQKWDLLPTSIGRMMINRGMGYSFFRQSHIPTPRHRALFSPAEPLSKQKPCDGATASGRQSRLLQWKQSRFAGLSGNDSNGNIDRK